MLTLLSIVAKKSVPMCPHLVLLGTQLYDMALVQILSTRLLTFLLQPCDLFVLQMLDDSKHRRLPNICPCWTSQESLFNLLILRNARKTQNSCCLSLSQIVGLQCDTGVPNPLELSPISCCRCFLRRSQTPRSPQPGTLTSWCDARCCLAKSPLGMYGRRSRMH